MLEGCHQRDDNLKDSELSDHLEKGMRTLLETLEMNLYRYVKTRQKKR